MKETRPRKRPHGQRAPALLLGASLLGSLGAGCAPRHHTVEPFRSDPLAAATLEARARERCTARARDGEALPPPERPFVTDGCSSWPDGEETVLCCVEHDVDYWCGGTAEARRAADAAFARCVAGRTDSPFLAGLMRAGVRLGGHPFWPMPYRWGYGHPWRGGYPDLAPSTGSATGGPPEGEATRDGARGRPSKAIPSKTTSAKVMR